MSLYNMMFGVNPFSKILCEAVGLKFEEIPRFRDSWYKNGIVGIYTRTGGGNRECYCYDCKEEEKTVETDDGRKHQPGCYTYMNEQMTKNKNYVNDHDDDYDCTYATFEFRVPEKTKEVLDEILDTFKREKPEDNFKRLIEKMQTNVEDEETKRAFEVGKMILEPVMKSLSEKEKSNEQGR